MEGLLESNFNKNNVLCVPGVYFACTSHVLWVHGVLCIEKIVAKLFFVIYQQHELVGLQAVYVIILVYTWCQCTLKGVYCLFCGLEKTSFVFSKDSIVQSGTIRHNKNSSFSSVG